MSDPKGWTITLDWRWNGYHVIAGQTEVTIVEKQGGEGKRTKLLRAVFYEHIATPEGSEWINVRGADRAVRSFHPDRIRTVHVKRKARAS